MGCGSCKRILNPPLSEKHKNNPKEEKATISRVEDLKIDSGTLAGTHSPPTDACSALFSLGESTAESEWGGVLGTQAFIQLLQEPFTECYQLLRELGSGQFGKVYLAEQRSTGIWRAVKVVNKRKSEDVSSRFIAEVEILSRLTHPNIIKIYEMFEDERQYYIVSELCSGGELFEHITQQGHLSETAAAEIMQQVFSAVSYCHEHHIVHRDLKPENLLLDSAPVPDQPVTVKLIDFGTSCLYSEENKMQQKLGTAYYVAPEVLSMNYNEKCDVWSCGVIMYMLLCGVPPFSGKTEEEILQKVRAGRFSFSHESWRSVSNEAKTLIRRMLVMDTAKRVTALECLKDPWIVQRVIYRTACSEAVALSLNQLKSFRAEQKLRAAFLTFMTSQMLSRESEKDLRDAFRAIDTNGDGKLSREELIEAYKVKMPLEEAQRTVESVLERVDLDKNGYIDYSEFVLASTDYQSLLSQKNLQTAFDVFDKDGSGKISRAELKEMLSARSKVDDGVWTTLINQADQNGDGEIEFREFCKLMQEL